MDELTYMLRGLCRRNRDGSHATQADRQRTLTLASRQLVTATTPRARPAKCSVHFVAVRIEGVLRGRQHASPSRTPLQS